MTQRPQLSDYVNEVINKKVTRHASVWRQLQENYFYCVYLVRISRAQPNLNVCCMPLFLCCNFVYQVVVLICDTFDTEECCDNLRVHDGSSANSYEIALLAGQYHNGVGVSSQGSSMYVRWHSDGSVRSAGFACRFESRK